MAQNTSNKIYNDYHAKGKNAVEALVKAGKISEDSGNYITCSLDPFHDFPVKPKGIPDGLTTQSVVKCVQKSVDIASPDGLAYEMLVHTGPMDWVDPTLTGFSDQVLLNRAGIFLPLLSGEDLGALSITTSSTTPFSLSNSWNPVGAGRRSISYANEVDGRSRLIGYGFEVTNTTPELYKGGAVTVCRKMLTSPHTTVAFSGALATPRAAEIYSGMPTSGDEMLRVPGSKQWAASEGVYCVGTKANDEFYGAQFTTHFPMLTAGGVQQSDVLALTVNGGSNARWTRTGLDYSGAHFKGLSAESTFTVTSRAYIEYLPNVESTDVDFITPAPPLEPEALELISHLRRTMPCGVHVGDNDGGDWFRFISSAIRSAVPAIFPPAAPAMVLAAPMLNKVTNAVATKLDNKKKKKAAPKKTGARRT